MQHYKILVVDDEPSQCALVKDVLGHANEEFQVVQAHSGYEALDILRRETVDAVLMDKYMPVMDGDEVCRRIRSDLHLKLLPVTMLTASSSPEELQRSFAMGATDFIPKPFNPIELLARLKSAIQTKRLTDQLDNTETILFSLARLVEAKDETTGDHCSRLAHMGMVFGRALGLTENQLEALRRGGILHDIGKLGIPDSILLKRGSLNDEEWALMRTHTIIGAHLCEGLGSMRDVVPIILHHHERWDGSGYPHGLAGEDIPLLARVFQIVDIYDALASERPYKNIMPLEQIIEIFKQECTRGWRDPGLVTVFLDILQNNREALYLPENAEPTIDEIIFNTIVDTGVIDWDRKPRTK